MRDLPLLSAGEELAAAATMSDGRDAEYQLAALGAAADEDTPLDLEGAEELLDRVREGEEARRLLVESTRRLVVSIARRHDLDGEATQVLLAAGDDALERAADRYDPAGGLPFSAFARWWV